MGDIVYNVIRIRSLYQFKIVFTDTLKLKAEFSARCAHSHLFQHLKWILAIVLILLIRNFVHITQGCVQVMDVVWITNGFGFYPQAFYRNIFFPYSLLKSVMLNKIKYVILCSCSVPCTLCVCVFLIGWNMRTILSNMDTMALSVNNIQFDIKSKSRKRTHCNRFENCILHLSWTIRQCLN